METWEEKLVMSMPFVVAFQDFEGTALGPFMETCPIALQSLVADIERQIEADNLQTLQRWSRYVSTA